MAAGKKTRLVIINWPLGSTPRQRFNLKPGRATSGQGFVTGGNRGSAATPRQTDQTTDKKGLKG